MGIGIVFNPPGRHPTKRLRPETPAIRTMGDRIPLAGALFLDLSDIDLINHPSAFFNFILAG